ncbi:MAG: porin, partial [Gammaproteobacteria bacterium]|nr:porin [Gammaproteobacteria bacterium]
MKKSIIATAVAAGVLATGAAQASPTVYGILHFAINSYSDNHWDSDPTTDPSASIVEADSPKMVSQTSAIGIKGSEDLGGGLKALYKAEFKINPFIKNDGQSQSLERRDVWFGLKGGWGKAAVGTMSSN